MEKKFAFATYFLIPYYSGAKKSIVSLENEEGRRLAPNFGSADAVTPGDV